MIRRLLELGANVERIDNRTIQLRLDDLHVTVYRDDLIEVILNGRNPLLTWYIVARSRELHVEQWLEINDRLKHRVPPSEVDDLQQMVKHLLLSENCIVESFDGRTILVKEGPIRWTIRQNSLTASYRDDHLYVQFTTYPSLVAMDRLRHLLQEVVRHAQVAMGSAQAYGTRGTGRFDKPLSADRQDTP